MRTDLFSVRKIRKIHGKKKVAQAHVTAKPCEAGSCLCDRGRPDRAQSNVGLPEKLPTALNIKVLRLF